MHCPFCGHDETKVIDSRLAGEGRQVRRRRECIRCAERYTTFESATLVMPLIIKRDGKREPFNEDKLRSGMQRALEKRPVPAEKIETAMMQITDILRASGEREVDASFVGELAMAALRDLDQVAFVRFASVYRSFEDVNEFRDEIKRLEEATKDLASRNQMSLLPLKKYKEKS